LRVGPAFTCCVWHFYPGCTVWRDPHADRRCPQRKISPRRFLGWHAGTVWAQTQQDRHPCNDPVEDNLARMGTEPRVAGRAQMMGRWARRRVLHWAGVQGRLVGGMAGSGCLVFACWHLARRSQSRYATDRLSGQ
jgi:hypothetical protein